MDLHYKQEIQVGLLVIVAMAILIFGLIWLSGRSIGGGGVVTFEVTFTSIQGVSTGDPVQISGVRVGRVAKVEIEDVDQVMVMLAVRSEFRPRVDALVEAKSLDFLGAKFINYRPGIGAELSEGAGVVGTVETDLAATANALADRASGLMIAGQEFLSPEFTAQVQSTMAAAERALNVVARVEGAGILDATMEAIVALRGAAIRLDSTLANPAIGESVSQLDEVMEGLREMSEGLALVTMSLGSIMQKIDEGKGSIGMAINDSTLHQDIHEVLQSLNELLKDIRENPGRYGPRSIKLF